MKSLYLLMVAMPIIMFGQQLPKQNQSLSEFGEMTTLVHFGGVSMGTYKPTQAEKERIAWFRNDKFGMFIHWGLYSLMEGYWKGQKVPGGEWALKMNKLPIEEYRQLAKQFNPTKFHADEWVSLAKAAGMKYIVITAKHHDGFAMFRSAVSSYNVVEATPFKRDPMEELKSACERQGLKFGIYYSQAQDWNEPDAYGNNWSFNGYRGDMDAYLDQKALPQIREICQQYHPAIMWFDTPGGMTVERAQKVSGLVRSFLPNVLINNRIFTGNEPGLWDYKNGGDNESFPQYSNIPWELCGTLNRSWAYKKWDTAFRPVSDLLFNLVDAVSKNGNYLLNIGPTGEGEITEPYAVRLLEIGKWLKVNGEAIYGCGGTAFGTEFGEYVIVDGKKKFIPRSPDWRCTTGSGKVYIHVFNWPRNGKLELPPLMAKIKKGDLLADTQTRITVVQSKDHVVLLLPADAPDPAVSVVRLTLEK